MNKLNASENHSVLRTKEDAKMGKKQPYNTPRLRKLGHIQELTLDALGSVSDCVDERNGSPC